MIERFTSDFKLVAKFFKNKRLGKTNLFEDDKIIHVQELLDFLAVFTNDKRYKDIKTELMKTKNEGRPVKVCHVAQAWEEKGIQKGKFVILYDLYKKQKLSLEDAAQEISMTTEEFLTVAKEYTN